VYRLTGDLVDLAKQPKRPVVPRLAALPFPKKRSSPFLLSCPFIRGRPVNCTIRILCLLSLVIAMVGCGPSGPATTTVSGKVTVGGEPLPGGSIQFVSTKDSNLIGGGQIKGDGTYEVPDAPVGECKVVIDNSHLRTSGRTSNKMGEKMNTAPAGLDIPGSMGAGTDTSYKQIDAAYASAETTTLSATVAKDKATHNFDLQ
jgi:hypothetical protein